MNSSNVEVNLDCYSDAADGPVATVTFKGNDDLDCPYLGWVRVVPRDGYIDVPKEFVTALEGGK